jgi:hypothetical protein
MRIHELTEPQVVVDGHAYRFEFKFKELFKPMGFDCEGGNHRTRISIFTIHGSEQIKPGYPICDFSTPRIKDGEKTYLSDPSFRNLGDLKASGKTFEPYSMGEITVAGPFTKIWIWGVSP